MEQHLCRVEWRKSLANLGSTVLSTVSNNNSNDRTNNDEEGTIQVEIDLYSLASPEQTNPMLFSGVLHDSFGETPGPLQGVADPSTFYNVVDSLSLYERGARVPSPATRLRMNPTISASGARRQRARTRSVSLTAPPAASSPPRPAVPPGRPPAYQCVTCPRRTPCPSHPVPDPLALTPP
ncbi:hypothetical protein AGDE_14664 [Angomonas deanei]|uniref:Uncharacterized protein n=1 Tax=Angomonas deanei TaxID=59799 RepID=A0A7G2CFB5_9TRYP|nr:hypothetical protein AGDE_14664 [Angomonas deanei]CAD2217717.1 hypothetical protein, conserved [Angomonas deanei]|eukprot:EPY20456.1 hypothetical protein AGDE_14664 [Angomonas deanei]